MERYIDSPVVDNTKGPPYYETVLLADIPPEDVPLPKMGTDWIHFLMCFIKPQTIGG
jgi:hypothetical protein